MTPDTGDDEKDQPMSDDTENEILEALADPITAAGMRLATPEETQVLVDHAVTHVMEQEELIRNTPLVRTVEGRPEIPQGTGFPHTARLMGEQIAAMVADVHDPSVAYGPNRDSYGKCVEVMWRAAYLAMETVARELGVTGYQHSVATLMAIGQMRNIEGPFTLVDLHDALYPQYDIPGRVAEFIDEQRGWLAAEARKLLSRGTEHAHPDVVEHWQKLAAYVAPEDPQ